MYITIYEAAKIIGFSRQYLSKLIHQGKFIKGRMVWNKHAGKKTVMFKVEDVQEYSKTRASVS